MTAKIVTECRTCKQQMLETEWGPMCRRALLGWKLTGDKLTRPFARHPESNPSEIEYLKKYGQPDAEMAIR